MTTTAAARSATWPPGTCTAGNYSAAASSRPGEQQTGIVPFGRLIEQVMTTQPYANAKRVFWIVDNGSSHRGQASIDRLHNQWRNLALIHLPYHASWPSQIELVFSVIQRKVLTPNDFKSLQAIVDRLDAFETTTTRSPPRSSGPSPAKTSSASRHASHTTNAASGSQRDHQRTNNRDH